MLAKLAVLLLVLTVVHTEKDYTDFVNHLKTNIENTTGGFYHSAYNSLAYISDTYGPRMWGGQVLEMVITEMFSKAKKDGFDNVHLEPVTNFTKWVRGKESLTLYSPRPTPQKLGVIAFGRSISGYLFIYSALSRLRSSSSGISTSWRQERTRSRERSLSTMKNGLPTTKPCSTDQPEQIEPPSTELWLP